MRTPARSLVLNGVNSRARYMRTPNYMAGPGDGSSDVVDLADADIDWGDVGSTAGAAAGTAVGGPAGGFLGSAIGGFFGDLFNGPPSSWDAAGPGVHDWFTAYGEQRFLDWMRANYPDSFGNLDVVLALLCSFYFPGGMVKRDSPWDISHHNYKQGVTEAAYEAMGFDYDATLASSIPNQTPNWVQLPGGNAVGPWLDDAAAAAASGEELSPNEQAAVDAALKSMEGTSGTTIALVGLAALLLLNR